MLALIIIGLTSGLVLVGAFVLARVGRHTAASGATSDSSASTLFDTDCRDTRADTPAWEGDGGACSGGGASGGWDVATADSGCSDDTGGSDGSSDCGGGGSD